MIRDTGSTVDFYFQAGYSSDYYDGLSFGYTANGSTVTKSIDYPSGAPNYLVASVSVTTSQTVTFKLNTATGIGGIGGPTTISASLDRDSAPSTPSTPRISSVTATSATVAFTDGANGGSAINSRQITYGTSPTGGTTTISTTGSSSITGLTPGTTYYFWARTHNALGYSAWSPRASAVTLKVPTAPAPMVLSSVTATTVDSSWQPPSSNSDGTGILAYEVGWGLSPSAPTTIISTVEIVTSPGPPPVYAFVPVSSPYGFGGLTPGTTYYFFVRAQSSVGWSPWSTPSSVRTVAGASVYVGTTPKSAVVYVNQEGTWRICEVWARTAGVWSPTVT